MSEGRRRPARRGTRRWRALLLLALVLAPAAVAVAATRIQDRDDARGPADLRAARVVHNRSTDELVVTVDLHEPLDPAALLNRSGPPGSVCANLWTRRRPAEAPPDYDVCATATEDGRSLRASVTRHGTTGAVRRAGPADVGMPSARRLVVRVDPDLLRRPARVRWTVQSAAFADGCPRATGCEDFVPDRPDTATTELGRPRSRASR